MINLRNKKEADGVSHDQLHNMLNNQNISPELRQILKDLLQLNPYFRKTASECLQNPIFDDIRNLNQEKNPKGKLKLSVDQDEAFDYETGKSTKYTKADFLNIIRNEASI